MKREVQHMKDRNTSFMILKKTGNSDCVRIMGPTCTHFWWSGRWKGQVLLWFQIAMCVSPTTMLGLRESPLTEFATGASKTASCQHARNAFALQRRAAQRRCQPSYAAVTKDKATAINSGLLMVIAIVLLPVKKRFCSCTESNHQHKKHPFATGKIISGRMRSLPWLPRVCAVAMRSGCF